MLHVRRYDSHGKTYITLRTYVRIVGKGELFRSELTDQWLPCLPYLSLEKEMLYSKVLFVRILEFCMNTHEPIPFAASFGFRRARDQPKERWKWKTVSPKGVRSTEVSQEYLLQPVISEKLKCSKSRDFCQHNYLSTTTEPHLQSSSSCSYRIVDQG